MLKCRLSRLFASLYGVGTQMQFCTDVPLPGPPNSARNVHTQNHGRPSQQESITAALSETVKIFRVMDKMPRTSMTDYGVPTLKHAAELLDLYNDTVELERSLPWYLSRSITRTDSDCESLRNLLSNAIALR